MMLGGISIWQLLIILVIVVLIFGTKKLRGLSGDLGGAVKDFKKAVKEDGKAIKDENADGGDDEEVVNAKVAADKETADSKYLIYV